MSENKIKFHGEIVYDTEVGGVHSDICNGCFADTPVELTEEYRKFIHDCLDEWLNKSNGTGAFWVGDPDYFYSWEKEE